MKSTPKRGARISRAAKKRIIELYGFGLGKAAIATHLTERGFSTAHGGSVWHPRVVMALLRREGLWDPARPSRPLLRRTAEDAFRSMIEIDATSGCHNWQGHVDRDGYGSFRSSGAHRFAYELRHGPLAGRHVHHVCANRRCVNPVHLLPVADATAHARLEKLEKTFIAEAKALAGEAAVAAA